MNVVTLLLLLFQTPSPAPLPTPHVPERTPALFTLIYVGGFALVILLLLLSLIRNRRHAVSAIPEDLPKEVRKRLGSTSTNRGLRALRWLFVLLSLGLFSFHIYWAHYASEENEKFQDLSYKDLRVRRLSSSTLRGWIFDRSGRVDQPLAYYKRDSSGNIRREYPMDKALAHLFGSDRGDPGLERALFGVQSGALPEALQVVKGEAVEFRGNQDVRLTIDRALQQAAVDQLKGKHGAVVILNPQTGDVLALYSEPSYSLAEVDDEATWIRLEANERDKPLVSRALGAYYIPGSTFKTVTMTAAFLAGEQDTEFTCSGGGYYAAPGANVIFDDGGPGEVHGRIKIDQAYEVSCNQYFAQMGVKLGPERLKRAAQLLGIGAYDTPSEALRGRKLPEIWDASTDAIKRALAPREATIVTGKQVTRYDLALMGYGQGYAGQMTPFQMALAASAIGNLEGKLMKPRIEYNVPPQPFNQVMTPQTAARLRSIMGLVTGGPSGTARGVFGPVKAAGINTGGKTGTAQKIVPVYDPKTGEPKRQHKVERDNRGNIIREYDEIIMDNEHARIDGWFLCIAPLEKPQLAMAVIVEGGGYGSRSAAPIAAALELKARDLGNNRKILPQRRKGAKKRKPNLFASSFAPLRLCGRNLVRKMKNRASSHLLLILIILGLEITGYIAVHRSGLLRGYETSIIGAVRDLLMFFPLMVLAIWLSRTKRFAGNWVLFTTAILLFAFGMLVQYRLYSDPEYNSRDKSAAREEKMQALRTRYIMENYDPVKKQMMGLPPTPAQPIDINQLPKKESNYSLWNALTSSYTWIPVFSFFAFAIAYSMCARDGFLLWLQRNSFIIVLFTLLPLAIAVVTSSAGKALGNMTPWEPSKIPFLVGFAGILTARYKDLAETYWGIPRARDIVPLLVMAMLPFVPFFALKDFGQMLIFSGAYTTLYLVAVRRWPQLLLFVGSVLLGIGILVVGALPRDVQEKVPLLPTIARPISAALPSRIQQRFHLWLDGFDPPSPEVSWWKPEYEEALSRDPRLKELAEQSPAMQRTVNVDIWFDKLAFQPAQAQFGIASGRTSGRGFGLGFPEVIPIADSDYIYAAIAEETGLAGGAVIILAIIIFVVAGVRTSLEARDMFTKLCAAGLTAFIGFQALVNIGGILRALPMTGITLPFVSHGGFSLITSFAMLGMLMAFSHRNARDKTIVDRPVARSSSPLKLEAVQ